MQSIRTGINHEIVGRYALLFLVFITPFAHTVGLRNLGLVLCLFYIGVDIYKEGINWNFPYKAPILLWLSLSWLSLFYTISFDYSLSELRHETIYTLILFYTAFSLVRKGMPVTQFFITFLTSFIVMTIGVIASYQYFGVWNSDYFSGVGNYSSYLAMILPVIFYLLFKFEIQKIRVLLLLFVPIALYAGLLSENRMLWVTLIIEAFAGILIFFFSEKRTNRHLVLLAVVTLLVALASLFALNAVKKNAENLEQLFTEDVRVQHWSNVFAIVEDRPVCGLGFGKNLLGLKYPELTFEDDNLVHAHNLVLDYAVMLGIPGAISIIWLFTAIFVFFIARFRKDPLLVSASILFLVGVLSKNMSDNFFGRDQSMIVWIFVGAISATLMGKTNFKDQGGEEIS